jgi:hypothetical protein
MPQGSLSVFRRWGVVILFGVLVVVVLRGFREFADYLSDSPIVDPYLAVINEMSLHSPRAHQRLEQYYATHQRQTVASKHYPWLCNEMQELAAQDGIPDRRSLACPPLLDEYEKP